MQPLALTVDEIETWLRLVSAPGLGPVTVRRLLAAFGLPQHVFTQSHAALASVVGETSAETLLRTRDGETHRAVYERTIEWVRAPDHHFVTLADPIYPPALLEMADPPPVLYVQGHLAHLHAPTLAIVGSRHASAQGLQDATQFARAFADVGLCIVSGLALGIDGAAHQGALEGRASTIAVIGTGIDIVYPARHYALAHRIATAGAIVSEWPLGTPARAAHFPQRNRLIAGLARGVLVIEAAVQSGALITARLATEMGREVFALPGSIHSPLSKGCHQLIKEGAQLVESIQDVLEALRPIQACSVEKNHAQHAMPNADAKEQAGCVLSVHRYATMPRRVLKALGYDPSTLEALVARTGLDSAELQATLCTLEIEGEIALLPGGHVVRLFKHD